MILCVFHPALLVVLQKILLCTCSYVELCCFCFIDCVLSCDDLFEDLNASTVLQCPIDTLVCWLPVHVHCPLSVSHTETCNDGFYDLFSERTLLDCRQYFFSVCSQVLTGAFSRDRQKFSHHYIITVLPSVLWRCWLGGRKGIWPVKNWVVGCWCGYLGWGADLHIAQQMPLLLTISCSSKSRLVLTFLVLHFWYLLTRVVPDIFQKSSKTVVCVYCHCAIMSSSNVCSGFTLLMMLNGWRLSASVLTVAVTATCLLYLICGDWHRVVQMSVDKQAVITLMSHSISALKMYEVDREWNLHIWSTSSTLFVISYMFLADRTIGRAYGTVCRLSSSVCDVLYCGKTVHPSQKVSEGVNRKPGSKSSFFRSLPYFYFRFCSYGPLDGRFLPYVLWQNGAS